MAGNDGDACLDRFGKQLIALTADSSLTPGLVGRAHCVFDVEARLLAGRASALSEVLRGFLFGAGLRFTYDGYERGRLDYAAMVAAGLERP